MIINNLLVLFFSLLCHFPAMAQGPRGAQPQIIWKDRGFVRIEAGSPNSIELIKLSGAPKTVWNVPSQDEHSWTTFWKDEPWLFRRHPQTKKLIAYTPMIEPKGAWKRAAVFDQHLSVMAAVPLEKDLFFMISGLNLFAKDGKASPWAIGSRDDNGVISIKSLVDLDLKEPLHTKKAIQDPKTKKIEEQLLFNFKYKFIPEMSFDEGFPIVRYPGGFVVVAYHPGYFWFFDDEGNFKKRMKLYDIINEDHLKNIHSIEWVVLSCQPLDDGSLLIATRTEDAVLHSREIFGSIKEGKPDPVALTLTDSAATKWFPDIRWWKLDPKEGGFESVSAPDGMPSRLESSEKMRSFYIDIGSKGNPIPN